MASEPFQMRYSKAVTPIFQPGTDDFFNGSTELYRVESYRTGDTIVTSTWTRTSTEDEWEMVEFRRWGIADIRNQFDDDSLVTFIDDIPQGYKIW
jgi:hypothetical protein